MKKLEKCVKLESVELNCFQIKDIETTLNAYLKCKNYFYDLLYGDQYMVKLQNASKLRTELSKNQKAKGMSYQDLFHIPQRYWVMPLFDVCSNLNSNWSNLANKLKKTRVQHNKNFTDDERIYCYVILSDRQMWYNVLHWITIKNKYLDSLKISDKRKKSLNNYIRRITKENMFIKPYSGENRCMWLDMNMYSYSDKFDYTKFFLSTLNKGSMLEIKLKGKVKFPRSGNLQVVYKKDKKVVELHKTIKTRTSDKKHKDKKGIDKGYANLFSCSDENEYGMNMGVFFTENTEWLNNQTYSKNFYIDLCKKIEKEKQTLVNRKNKTTSVKEEHFLSKRIHILDKKIMNIKTNNLGNKKFNKAYGRRKEYCAQRMNHEIIRFFTEHDLKILGVEDLTFVNYMAPYKGRKFNRKMSYWLKGLLENRLEYIAKRNGCEIVKVNAAHTSKFCAKCGAKLEGRTGKHNEIAICPNCGELNANTNSAKLVEDRIDDKEITLYTPHDKVKEIMEQRYLNNKKKNKNLK